MIKTNEESRNLLKNVKERATKFEELYKQSNAALLVVSNIYLGFLFSFISYF